MLTSFSTALSALTAQATAIDVVGNNLANLNTPGFKTSVVSFHDMVSQSLGSGAGDLQVGSGVGRPVTLREFSQGAIQTTSGPLDAAIQGDGFFVVTSLEGATEYTRGGNFRISKEGGLITSTGEKLQGWSALDATGTVNTNGPVGDITVPVGSLKPPVATKNLSFDLNLNAAGKTADTYTTAINVYDSLGNPHSISLAFSKDAAANTWNYSATAVDADLSAPFTPVTGQIVFDSNGKLTSPAPTDPPVAINLTGLVDGASDLSVNWSMYDGTKPRLTQFSQTSAVSALAQDGSPTASLLHVGLADGGKVLAQYSSGEQVVVGQLALATLRNPDSLDSVGNNNYQVSARSALPAVGLPNSGGRGSILGGSVEASTVDIATEFTNMIVFQRAYQANAKVVTTVDEISQDTINLKR